MVLHHVDLNSYNPPLSLKKREDPPLTVPQLWESYGDLMHKRAMLLDDDGFATTETVHLARLTPNTMQWHVTNPVAGHLRVLSAWTDGWSYRVGDGDWNAVPRRRSDFNTLYVPVPAGEEVAVEFRFEPWWLKQSIGVMIFGYVASLGLALLGAFSGWFRSRGGRRKLGVSEA